MRSIALAGELLRHLSSVMLTKLVKCPLASQNATAVTMEFLLCIFRLLVKVKILS